MALLTADRNTSSKEVGLKSYPVAVDIIYKGSMVCIDSSGYLVPASDTSGLSNVVGVADENVDNSGGSAGDKNCRVRQARAHLFAASSIVQANVGDTMFVVDDQTFDNNDPGNGIRAGILVEFVSSTSGWILVAQLFDLGTINSSDIGAAQVLSNNVEPGLIQYKDTQLTAAQVNALMGTNIEVVPTPGANLAAFPVRVGIFLDHGGTDFVQVNNTDQLALTYSASNEIGEIGSEAQCTALLEASADAALIDPLNLAGFIPEANTAIDLDNNGAAEYTTGDGTLSIRVWFVVLPMIAFT